MSCSVNVSQEFTFLAIWFKLVPIEPSIFSILSKEASNAGFVISTV
ncbi:MAG: hypothetical protein ACFWUJ_10010 [Pseudomonas fragi]